MKTFTTIYSEVDYNIHVHSFLNATICLRRAQLLECLENYSRSIGNAINDYQYCYFAQELDPEDTEYFGSCGVAVYNLDMLANCMYVTVMTEKQFFAALTDALNFHRHRFSANEWALIQSKLCLLLVDISPN